MAKSASLLGIKALSNEIFFETKGTRKSSIRKMLVLGNPESLWNVASMAKNSNVNDIPPCMKIGNVEVDNSDLAETFADYYDKKFKNIVKMCKVDQDVYNGKKLSCVNSNFVNHNSVVRARFNQTKKL